MYREDNLRILRLPSNHVYWIILLYEFPNSFFSLCIRKLPDGLVDTNMMPCKQHWPIIMILTFIIEMAEEKAMILTLWLILIVITNVVKMQLEQYKYELKRTTLTLLVIFRLDIAMLTLTELDSDREQSE